MNFTYPPSNRPFSHGWIYVEAGGRKQGKRDLRE